VWISLNRADQSRPTILEEASTDTHTSPHTPVRTHTHAHTHTHKTDSNIKTCTFVSTSYLRNGSPSNFYHNSKQIGLVWSDLL